MTVGRRSGGSWTELTTLKRRASGSWTNIADIKRRASGVWVQVWPLVRLTNTNTDAFDPVATAKATSHYRLNSTGIAEVNTGDGTVYSTAGTWLLVGSNSDYEARATIVDDTSGTLSGTFGSWLSLSSARIWTNNNLGSGGGVSIATITVEIRDIATSTVRTSATITLSSELV